MLLAPGSRHTPPKSIWILIFLLSACDQRHRNTKSGKFNQVNVSSHQIMSSLIFFFFFFFFFMFVNNEFYRSEVD